MGDSRQTVAKLGTKPALESNRPRSKQMINTRHFHSLCRQDALIHLCRLNLVFVSRDA